jgi:HEAT repeat protein
MTLYTIKSIRHTVYVLSAALCGALAFAASSGTLAAAEKTSVADWVEKLKDKHKDVRLRAAKALGDLGTPAKEAVPELVKCLKDKDLDVRRQAAQALAQIGPSAVTALQETLKDEEVQTRLWAVEALALLAPDVKEAVPVLLEAVKDRAAVVRAIAVKGLLTTDAETSVVEPVFQGAVKDENPYVNVLGDVGLEQLKAKANGRRPAVPINPGPVIGIQRLTPAQEAQLDKIVDTYARDENPVNLPVGPRTAVLQAKEIVIHLGPESIPVLVRGANEAYTLKSSCPFGGISLALLTAVSNCNDPQQLDYAILNLGKGVPEAASMLASPNIKQILTACTQRKTELLLLTLAAEKQAEFNRMVDKAQDLGDADLRVSFKEKDADARLAALTAAAARRLHCEDDLIAALADPDPRVGQFARQYLMRLSRGTDFGPAADAGDAARKSAQKRWREWWKQQDQNPNADTTKTDPPAPAASPGDDLAAAAKLADDLANADAAGRAKPLAALRDGKGVAYTDALAVAVGKLQGEARDQARTALEDRLAKLPVGALRERLLDADAELRRAAAAAAGQKMDREFAPELIHLLSDDDAAAAAAARAALRALSGEDFGPADGADKKAKAEAVKKWRAWWTKQQEK